MEGASTLKQHDNMHKQIVTFEKLLQHAINRFSTEKLYHKLRLLLREMPYLPRIPRRTSGRFYTEPDQISSVGELREIVAALRESVKERLLEKEEGANLVKYFDAFFDDLGYLRELKQNFDEKIYACLYEYFYDPLDDTFDARSTMERLRKRHVTFEEDVEEEAPSYDMSDNRSGGSEETDDKFDEKALDYYFDKLTDHEKLSVAVRKMYQWNIKWDILFSEDDLESQVFDPDSRHEILQYSNYEGFEFILRLVPDVFVKSYKSVELAKLWWTQANKVYTSFPGKKRSALADQDYRAEEGRLEGSIDSLRMDIRRHRELLRLNLQDLEHLQSRETRYRDLGSQCEQLEDRKNFVGQRYNEMLLRKEALKHELSQAEDDSEEQYEILGALRDCSQSLLAVFSELRMLRFQLSLAQDDFDIELGVRPDLIRFAADIEAKIESLEADVEGKENELLRAEKRLVLLRTNCDRMRQIMRKYLDSKASSDQSSVTEGNRKSRRFRDRQLGDRRQNDLEVAAEDFRSDDDSNGLDDNSGSGQSPSEVTRRHKEELSEDQRHPKKSRHSKENGGKGKGRSRSKIPTRTNHSSNHHAQDGTPRRRKQKASDGKTEESRLGSQGEELLSSDGNEADTESPSSTRKGGQHGTEDRTTKRNRAR